MKKTVSGRIFLIVTLILAVSFFFGKPLLKKIINKEAVRRFNIVFYDSSVWEDSTWLGVQCAQNPCDSWVMQEMISEIKPDFIVETGTFKGGSTLFYATVLEKVNKNGKVITVDIEPDIEKAEKFNSFKERVEVIIGDSVSPEVTGLIGEKVKGRTTLVTLDSLHTKEHVLKELQRYAPFVSIGSYIVVQDTNINGHPVRNVHDAGPWEAVEEFLKTNKNFEIDHSKEKFLTTHYPSGFLKRVK